MRIIEVAVQGLRGLPSLVRLALPPGLSVLPSEDAARRRALIDALFHTLQPDAAETEVIAALQDGSPSRSSVTILGRDERTYRLLRDFANGATRLLRVGAGEQLEPLSQERAEVARWLRVQLLLPDERSYERLFVISPSTLAILGAQAKSRRGDPLYPGPALATGPSAPGRPVAGGSSVAAMGALRQPSPAWAFEDYGVGTAPLASLTDAPATAPLGSQVSAAFARSEPTPGTDRTELLEAKRLDYLRLLGLLDAARSARAVLLELDQLHSRRLELRPRVEQARALALEIEELSTNLNVYGDLVRLPPDTGERVRLYEGAGERRTTELKRLAEEKRETQLSIDGMRPYPLIGDVYFRAGAALSVLSFALALALGRSEIALANILGAMLMTAASLLHVGRLEKVARLELRVTMVEEREARVEKQYEAETASIRKVMTAYQIEDPLELLERIEAARALRGRLEATQRTLAELESEPRFQAQLAQLSEVEARCEVLESQVMGLEGTDAAKPAELEKRLVDLERELKEAGIHVPPVPPVSGGSGPRPPARAVSGVAAPVIGTPIRIVSGTRLPATADEEEDDTPGYGGGYGSRSGGGSGQPPPSGSAGAAGVGLWAVGSGGLPPGALGGRSPGYSGGAGGDSGAPGDASRYLVEVASDLLHQSIEAVAELVRERLGQYLSALTGGTYAFAEIGPRGHVRLARSAGTEAIPFSSVPAPHALPVEAAIRLALLEQVARRVPAPILIDDPFLELTPAQRAVLNKTLRYLAQMTQVLVLTSATDIEGTRLEW
ncbi:MAG: hypothetical protein IT384_30350 [Deltaproteobacteria bacterium]|nr:hypothetical protein [Deltaproteobacteria bacterium]